MTGTQARLTPSADPHTHVWQIDFEKPSRSVCACGKVRQHKPIPWSDSEEPKPKRRTQTRRKGKPTAVPGASGKGAGSGRKWKRRVKG